MRIDSEYFSKKYAHIDNVLLTQHSVKLSTLVSKISDGTHFTPNYIETGVKFLSAINVSDNYFDLEAGYKYISENEHNQLYSRCNPEYNDVLMRKVGVGIRKACVVPKVNEQFSIFVSVALIKCRSINPYYLSTFINSKYGQTQFLRFNKGIGQPDLHLEDIARCLVPIFPISFQQQIENIVKNAHSKIEDSKQLYTAAEDQLMSELGLKDWQPENQNINVKNLSDSFLSSGRLDAEYYQSKYDEIEKKIKSNYEYVSLFELFDILSNPSPKQYYSEGIKVIKTKNIRIPAIEYDTISDCTMDNCLKIKNGDLLFASMGVGSLGRMSFVFDTKFDCTIDGTIKLLRTKEKYKNQYLEIPTLLFLTSTIGQDLIYKNVIGSTGIISISKESIENLIVPIVNQEKRIEITKMVYQSFALKAESKRLLEQAKLMVEQEIEKGGK